MGRKSLPLCYLKENKDRRICFIKRRIGAVKKLMQLSVLTGCKVQLKIYSEEDKSLLEYQSDDIKIDVSTDTLDSYLNLQNKDLIHLANAEMSMTK
jgi:hypothetical protein